MDLNTILKYTLAVIGVILTIIILLQSNQGGLGSTFGGGASTGGEGYRSKRGFEAVLYNGTIVLGILFAVLSLAIVLLNV